MKTKNTIAAKYKRENPVKMEIRVNRKQNLKLKKQSREHSMPAVLK